MNKDLTVGKPEKVLFGFCVPLLLSVVFQQLYNIADSLIAGRYAGEAALAAVGNSYEITLVYLAFAFGCNMGCSVMVSQYFGAGNHKDMKTAIYTTFISSGILCLILMLTGFLFGGTLLRLVQTPANIFDDSKLYLDIYTAGLFFLFFYNISTGIFSALGDSRTPFVFLAISSVSNVILDYIFVKYLDMGVAGVAWATFICQGLSCIFAVCFVIKRINAVGNKNEERIPVFSGTILKKIVAIAVPSTLQQGFVSVGNIFIQRIINGFGSSVIAGYSASIKLNNLVITSLTALGNGVSNYTAQNIGAGKYDRIRKGHRAGIKLVVAICIPISLLYWIFGGFFVKLFMDSDVNRALDVGVRFLRIVAPFYVVVAMKLLSDGVLRGASAMRQFMTSTFTDLILRVGLAFVLSGYFGETGIWSAWPFGWTAGTALSVYFYVRLRNKLEARSE